MVNCLEFSAHTGAVVFRSSHPCHSRGTSLSLGDSYHGLYHARNKRVRRGPEALNSEHFPYGFQGSKNRFSGEVTGGSPNFTSSTWHCFSPSSPSSMRDGPSLRAEADNGPWGTDDQDHSSPLTSDNGVSLFDYSSLHIVGASSQVTAPHLIP